MMSKHVARNKTDKNEVVTDDPRFLSDVYALCQLQ